MTDDTDDLVCLGAIATAHGVRGLVKVKSFTERPEDIAAYGPLTDRARQQSFRLTLKGRTGGLLLAAVEGIDDRTAAERLRGTELYVAREALPEPDEEAFYWSDLEGLAVHDRDGRRIGRVEALLDYGAGPVLQIRLERGGELLLPFAERFVPTVDLEGGRLTVEPPEEVTVPPSAEPREEEETSE